MNATDPMLYYKLDPGEWGSSAPATAATSISRVASHESANIQRFEHKAAQKGCYVIGKDLYLNLNKEGSYLAATSGRSSVLTYCPKKEKAKLVKAALGSKINAKLRRYSEDELRLKMMLKSLKNKAEKSLYEQDLKKIRDRKLQLEEAKFRLYTEITLLLAQNLQINPSTININV